MKNKHGFIFCRAGSLARMLLTILVVWLISACTDQEQQGDVAISSVTLDKLPWVDSKSKLDVSLWSADGKQVTNASQLKPGTSYELKVISEVPLGLKVKVTDGFTVEGSDTSSDDLTTERLFQIRTLPELPGQLYLNIVPLYHRENGLIRERPQSFLLPGTN